MIDLLINLVTPVFVSLGASAADVSNYIHSVGGYIYAIFAALLVAVIVMVAAHFLVKKGTRHVIRWSAVGAFLLATLLIVNMICYGPLYATMSGVLNASKAEISDDVVGNSVAVIEETGEEGIVLVKNNGLLPLAADATNLNVFGWSSVCPVYSGTGSAVSGDAGPALSILKSLADAGYSMNNDLVQMYLAYASTRPSITMQTQDWTLPEPTRDAYTAEVMDTATSFSDTAVIVIGRSGGENADLPVDMNAVIKGTYNVANTDVIPDNYKNNYGYNGSYGYQISDAAVRAGNDLMLGYGMSASNEFTDTDAATCVLAMRQACKNILYTVGNSGYYAEGVVIEEGGMDNMNRLFLTVDIAVVAVALVVLAIVVIRWKLKRKKAAARAAGQA